eukprot:jgi/Chlat1/4603/Chrsp290S04346
MREHFVLSSTHTRGAAGIAFAMAVAAFWSAAVDQTNHALPASKLSSTTDPARDECEDEEEEEEEGTTVDHHYGNGTGHEACMAVTQDEEACGSKLTGDASA